MVIMYRCGAKENLYTAEVKVDKGIYAKIYLLLSLVGSRREKEIEYGNGDDRVSRKKRRKKKSDTDLEFFHGFPL